MKRLFLLFSVMVVCVQINAQGSWLRAKYVEIDFQRRLKAERNLVKKTTTDTVYIIWLNATVHYPDRLYPHILWYHQGDSIVAYSIKTFHNKKYVVLDTAATTTLNDLQHRDCFSHGGWDLLEVYVHGKLINSTVFDQVCILASCARNSFEKRLQHDIALLQEKIPGWISPPSSIYDVKSSTTTRQNPQEDAKN